MSEAAVRERKSRICRILAVLLIFGVLLPVAGKGTAEAVTQAEIDALKGDANSLASQKKEIQEQLKALQADKDAALRQRDLLEKQIYVVQQELNNIESQIVVYNQLVAQKEEELRQAEAEEAAQYELFCHRIRLMEEEGEVSYWAILFSSKNFSELLDNYIVIEEIIQYDNRVMDNLAVLQERVSADKAGLEAARTEQEEAQREQESVRQELKAQEEELDKLIQEINSREDQLEAMEREVNESAKNLDNEIKRLEREMAEQVALVKSESGFLWPLAGSLNILSSLYGPREHPTTHQPGNHSGIDIPAAKNTPIYAAKSGVVVTSILGSGGYWSYGNYVLISHSDGTSTLYAHMEKRNVSKGQVVKQGDVIGYVGTTGRSSGNHLHFEIRSNGLRKDPMDYFQDKALYVRENGKLYPLWDWMK